LVCKLNKINIRLIYNITVGNERIRRGEEKGQARGPFFQFDRVLDRWTWSKSIAGLLSLFTRDSLIKHIVKMHVYVERNTVADSKRKRINDPFWGRIIVKIIFHSSDFILTPHCEQIDIFQFLQLMIRHKAVFYLY
jgi:hypothetical protein